jgi:hypothetical protein
MILAQTPTVTPTDKQIAAAEMVAEKILSGIPSAADAQPVQYLNLLLILAVLGVILFLARRVFIHLESNASLAAKARADEAAETQKSREYLERIADGFGTRERLATERERVAQDTCHSHSLAMLTKANDGAVRIAEATSNLQLITTDLKGAVHDVRNIAQENKSLVENILFDRGQKAPMVNQVINPLPSKEQD